MASSRASPVQLAVILGAARSGTTLLRALLDAHPEIGCPAEAGLPGFIGGTRRLWQTVCASDMATAGRGDAMPPKSEEGPVQLQALPLPEEAETEIRRAAQSVMAYYCGPHGKRVYCDKSLDAVHHLPAVHAAFPDCRYIVLVRHVMDTIASGLEASPWGFNAFGYMPFVQASPDNIVLALARYWEMQVSGAVGWMEKHGDQCHRVTYEVLVNDPTKALADICRFLGVGHEPGVLAGALERVSAFAGPGDYKLPFTRAIHSRSIGRGKRVPVALIPPPLVERLNELLAVFGYRPLTSAWNAEASTVTRVGASASQAALKRAMTWVETEPWEFDLDSVAIVADDDPSLRWIVDLAHGVIRPGDGDVELVVMGAADDIAEMLRAPANLGSLLRAGRIRTMSADGVDERRLDLPRLLLGLCSRLTARVQGGGAVVHDRRKRKTPSGL
jgi:hypothetical protein